MCTVYVVGLVGSRAQPQVVVQFLGNGLHFQVLLSCPEELPGEACGTRDAHFQGPSQQAAVDKLLERLHIGAQSVEGVLEAEPCVQSENPAVALHGFFHPFPLADGAGHRLLAEDVLAGIGCFHRHDTVPVGGCGNVYYVYIRVVDEVAEIVVCLGRDVPFCLGCFHGRIQVFLVHIAQRHHAAAFVVHEMQVATSDASHADNATR